MTSMIERVARAIGGVEMGSPVDEPGERWRNWEEAARAAIAAMREPTDAMDRAGDSWGETASILVWERMIDAALKE